MITTSDIEALITLAANEWPGVSTLKSDHRRAIRLMAQATHNTCAACGETQGETTHLAHIVSAREGWGVTANNVYVAHPSCNDFDREACAGDPYAILSSMVRPDLVLGRIPKRAEALAFLAAHDASERALSARRNAARMARRSA